MIHIIPYSRSWQAVFPIELYRPRDVGCAKSPPEAGLACLYLTLTRNQLLWGWQAWSWLCRVGSAHLDEGLPPSSRVFMHILWWLRNVSSLSQHMISDAFWVAKQPWNNPIYFHSLRCLLTQTAEIKNGGEMGSLFISTQPFQYDLSKWGCNLALKTHLNSTQHHSAPHALNPGWTGMAISMGWEKDWGGREHNQLP